MPKRTKKAARKKPRKKGGRKQAKRAATPGGSKSSAVQRLLNGGELSAAQISKKVGCSTSYVYMVKNGRRGDAKRRAAKPETRASRAASSSVRAMRVDLKRAENRLGQLKTHRARLESQLAAVTAEITILDAR